MTKHKRYLIPTALVAAFAFACSIIASATPPPEQVSSLNVTTTAASPDDQLAEVERAAAKKAEDDINLWVDTVERNNFNSWVWVTNTQLQQKWIDNTNAAIAAQKERDRQAAAERAANQITSRSPSSSSSSSGSSVGSHGGVCNGVDLPPCYVVQRESGFNPTAKNPSSSACGLYQFIASTWANFGGYSTACQAPVAVQVAKARIIWAGGAGCSHWSAC